MPKLTNKNKKNIVLAGGTCIGAGIAFFSGFGTIPMCAGAVAGYFVSSRIDERQTNKLFDLIPGVKLDEESDSIELDTMGVASGSYPSAFMVKDWTMENEDQAIFETPPQPQRRSFVGSSKGLFGKNAGGDGCGAAPTYAATLVEENEGPEQKHGLKKTN